METVAAQERPADRKRLGNVGQCDLCNVRVGPDATVYPAAEFPLELLRRGGSVIEVNPEPSELSDLAVHSLRGPGGAVLTALLEQVTRARAESAR